MQLLERDAELHSILHHAQAAQSGSGSVIAISGEAGAGKSALLGVALDTVRQLGLPILSMRCFRDDESTPYAALHRLVSSVPELGAMMPEPLGTASARAHSEAALRREIVGALTSHRDAPAVVIAIDDLQWIDGQTAEVVRSLGQVAATNQVLLVCTVLDRPSFSRDVEEFISTLIVESGAVVLTLEPLSETAVAVVMDQAAPDLEPATRRQAAHDIFRLSAGNPFFATELAAVIADRRHVRSRDHLPQLPATIRHAVAHRLRSVDAGVRSLLEWAALFPRGISAERLRAVTGRGEEEARYDVAGAIEGGFLVNSPDFGLQFRHEIIRRHIEESQSLETKQRRHDVILSALQDHSSAGPPELAYHAVAAGRFDDAIRLFEEAGHRAIRVFALDEAARYFEQAVQAAERVGADEAVRDRTYLAHAGALILIDPQRADQEISDVISRALARDDQLTLARARQRRAIIIYQSGQVENVLPLLNQSIPVLEEHREEQTLAEAYAYIGYCGSLLNDYALVLQATDRLQELSASLDLPMYRGIALNLRAVALVARGEQIEDAPQLGRDSVSITYAVGRVDLATAFAAVTFSSVDYWCNLDHPEQVDELIERSTDLARRSWDFEEFPGPLRMLWTLGWSYLRGDWQMVREELPDLKVVRSASIPQVYKDTLHNVAAELVSASGEPDRALDILSYVARSPDTLNGRHAYRQWLLSVEQIVRIHLEAREIERAGRWINTLDRALEHQPYRPGEHLLDLCRARHALAVSDVSGARDVLSGLITELSRANNWLLQIRALILQSSVLAQCAEPALAAQSAERAIRGAVDCLLPYEEACARLARAALGPGQALSRDTCLDDARTASSIAMRLNAPALLATATRLRATLEERGRRGGLTRRELDVLRLVAEGMTDNEIADRLFISPRTVGTHISNMLNKTSTSNRVELATWAIANEVVPRDLRYR